MKNACLSVAVAVGLFGMVGLSAGAAAQQPLTAKQIEELAAKAATPADHGQLGRHFSEMAVRLTADADAYQALAAGYRRSSRASSRSADEDPAVHSDRIAQQAREGAAAARELATYHERLGRGLSKSDVKTPVRPMSPMADVHVQQHIVSATTAAEHTKASQEFAAEAARYAAEAERHAGLPAAYRLNADRQSTEAAIHCDRFVQRMKDAAAEARTLATYHRQLAAGAAKR